MVKKILKIIWLLIKTLLLTYAVLFAIAGTSVIVWAYIQVDRPIKAVKKLKTENPQKTLYMLSYDQTRGKAHPQDTLLQKFVPLDSISPLLIKAVIASEDDGFYIHPGFDIEAILQAYQYNKGVDRISHGASTLTQQLSKNLFVGGEKSFVRKYHELIYSILMEKYLGKNRILELYLNYAQWGESIFGCEAASQVYFKKPCKKLTLLEASRLAAVLAKPCKLAPTNYKSGFIAKRLQVIAINLYRKHIIDDSNYLLLGGPDSLLQQKAEDSLDDNSSSEPAEKKGYGFLHFFDKPKKKK